MAELSENLRRRIRDRHDLWREVCVLSLELLEGTTGLVDAVLALYRDPASTREQFIAAHAAAHAVARTDDYVGNAYAYAAATAAVNAVNAVNAVYAVNAAAAATAATAAANAAKGNKVERFIADLELLVSFAPVSNAKGE